MLSAAISLTVVIFLAIRSIIGVNMDGASSILLLLQVCASSLSRINSQKNQSKSETIFTFGNVVSFKIYYPFLLLLSNLSLSLSLAPVIICFKPLRLFR